MCTVCGCNETEHTHDHSHEHEHDHNHSHQHHYGKGDAGLHIAGMSQQKIVQVEMDILSKNNRYANENRALCFAVLKFVINLSYLYSQLVLFKFNINTQ
jgi:hydrogenase nickel incorporation protein HypB